MGVSDDNDLPMNSKAAHAIAYSPTIAVSADDPLLARLNEIHGRDARRWADDLTDTLAKLAKGAD
jgi:hypothetical protein